MRGGICTVQQALTPEATTTVKQAVGLAKRRGHAQVTPLHVASAMLATSAGLLRKACLQCHSHPLQCKALELCFNVALNRLPASGPGQLLAPPPHHHYPNPSFSNALVAAFKRAQAHQRRGSAENQQQPILALKIELEQLVVSILDDPSVSRVMREAGFSSPQVKSRVEQAVSPEAIANQPSNNKPLGLVSHHLPSNPNNSKPFEQIRIEDVNNVLSVMLKKRKNTVVVGECLTTAENVARGVIETFERGNTSYNTSHMYLQFIDLPLFSLRNISKEEVDQKLAELRCVVKSYVGRGVVFYLGDLTWVSELWSSRRSSSYFALEQIIMELKRLVSGGGGHAGENSSPRVWLMGISTFQSYMKCKIGHPSLETLWELDPLTIPVGSSLSLSLKFESDVEADVISAAKASKDIVVGDEKHISCCADHCSFNVDHKHYTNNSSTISSLPSWLQKYRDEIKRNTTDSTHHQEYCMTVGDLCKKWNIFCSPGQKHPHFAEKPLINNFSSLSPQNTFSSSQYDHFNHTIPNKQSPKEYQFWALENNSGEDDRDNARGGSGGDNLDLDHEPAKPELLSNPNSSPNSASSSEVIVDEDEDEDEALQSFKDLNAENLRILCDEMGKDVPWQKEIVPEIATTVLQCRSGMSQRKSNVLKQRQCFEKEENCWLFFLGADSRGKEKIARTLAKLVFGSRNNSFVSISLSRFSSRAGSSEECPNKHKRARDESGCSYVQRLGEAMNENPRRVFFLEDLEEVDRLSLKGIEKAIEAGRITLPCGETVPLKDSIVIFSSESFATSGSRASSPKRSSSSSQKFDHQAITKEKDQQVSLDLNIAVLHEDHGNDQDDDHEEDSDSVSVGILESVDRKFVFTVQE